MGGVSWEKLPPQVFLENTKENGGIFTWAKTTTVGGFYFLFLMRIADSLSLNVKNGSDQ
jgi:hypothetical protein